MILLDEAYIIEYIVYRLNLWSDSDEGVTDEGAIFNWRKYDRDRKME
jgi:hypothetical protein